MEQRRRQRTLRIWTILVGVTSALLVGTVLPHRPADAGGCYRPREEVRKETKEREERERKEKEEEERRRKEAEQAELHKPPPPPPEAPRSAPTPTTVPAGASTAPSSSGRRTRRTAGRSSLRETWRGWWVINDRALLPPRHYRASVASDGAVTTPSDDDERGALALDRRREHVIEEQVIPLLLKVLDPESGSPDLMLRGGLIAIGKAARGEAEPALLVHWLLRDDAPVEVREAAALGVGLLRRTETRRQLAPPTLDALRSRLLSIVGDDDAPEAVRATCALSLGLLGDQPFGRRTGGRLLTQRIWRQLSHRRTGTDLTIGLLTALGLQPSEAITQGMRSALVDAATGRPALDRSWGDDERSHALTALVTLDGADALSTLCLALSGRRVSKEVRRAGLVAVGRTASALDGRQRADVASALRSALRRAHDPMTRGLADIAVGELIAAHAVAGGVLSGDIQALWKHLLADARNGSTLTRGFAALALGVAFHACRESATLTSSWRQTRRSAVILLRKNLESRRGDADQQAAYAVALGLLGADEAVAELVSCVEDRTAPQMLRWDASVALAQIGSTEPEVSRALNVALFDRHPRVRTGAALGLSLLSGPVAGRRLLRELEQADTAEEVGRLTEPLGYLCDPAEAQAIVRYASDAAHGTYARASMLVTLGNVADPEVRPSLGRLGRHANYPAEAPSLMAVLLAR